MSKQGGVTLNDIERLVEQNRRLTDEVKKRLDQLAAINSVATLVSQSLDLELALEASLAAVMDVINVEATGISMIDEQGRELVLVAQRGWKRDFVEMGMRMPMGHGLAWHAIEHDELVVTGDVSNDERIKYPAFQEEGIKAQALAPMHARGRIIGILSAMSYSPYEFSKDELDVLSAIASQIGIALDNARLMSDAINNRNRLQSILDSTADAILSVDENYCLSSINDAAEAMFSLIEAQHLNRTLAELGLPEEIERGLREAAQRKTYSPLVFDMAYERKEKLVLSCAISPVLNERRKPDGWVVVMRDVTYKREVESIKDQVIRTAAHDLRDPLSLISGALDMLQAVTESPTERQESLLELALKGVDRMARLVEDLLNIERIEMGFKVKDKVNMGSLLTQVVDEYRSAAEEKSLSLITHVPTELPVLSGSKLWLERAVANYLSNAIKYSPEGGTIQARLRVEDKEMFLEVEDEGPGIPLEAQRQLFERFYRVKRRGHEGGNGTGLGLAIAKRVVEQHGGRVYVRSQPNKGSLFGFVLPMKKSKKK